jgi:hypothetical protein
MTEVERLQQLEHVEPHVKVGKFGIKRLEVGVLRIVTADTSACVLPKLSAVMGTHVDVFRHDRRRL